MYRWMFDVSPHQTGTGASVERRVPVWFCLSRYSSSPVISCSLPAGPCSPEDVMNTNTILSLQHHSMDETHWRSVCVLPAHASRTSVSLGPALSFQSGSGHCSPKLRRYWKKNSLLFYTSREITECFIELYPRNSKSLENDVIHLHPHIHK